MLDYFYPLAKKVLFKFDPETAHTLALSALKICNQFHLPIVSGEISHPSKLFGEYIINPIGLASGMDKDGLYINEFGKCGFGFLEVGGVTPLAQPGNPLPRLFRIVEREAIINRFGFNNLGVEQMVDRLKEHQFKGPIGVNIGKNAQTPLENAVQDYELCIRALYQHCDYLSINVSSPNTKDLRKLLERVPFTKLFLRLKEVQKELSDKHGHYTPMVVKLSPDLDEEDLTNLAHLILELKLDGVIATNTTVTRESIKESKVAIETGGLSGKPLFERALNVVKCLGKVIQNEIPLIGVGGISTSEDARKMLAAGASHLQIYSSFVYQGRSYYRSQIFLTPLR